MQKELGGINFIDHIKKEILRASEDLAKDYPGSKTGFTQKITPEYLSTLTDEEIMLLLERLGDFSRGVKYKFAADSKVDAMTGCLSANALHKLSKDEKKFHSKSALLIVDLDNLKSVNGLTVSLQAAGDRYIKIVAKIMLLGISGAEVYRKGGDEFVILLENCSKEAAEAIGRRLVSEFNDPPAKDVHSERERFAKRENFPEKYLGISFGAAKIDAGKSYDVVLKEANEALKIMQIKKNDAWIAESDLSIERDSDTPGSRIIYQIIQKEQAKNPTPPSRNERDRDRN